MSQSKHNPVASLAKAAQALDLFPVRVLQHRLPGHEALNRRLGEIILQREKAAQSSRLSNRGGWQGSDNIFSWQYPEIERLHDYIQKALGLATDSLEIKDNRKIVFKAYGWANVNRDGDYNVLHVHPASTWSCVYYVDIGNPGRADDNGNLELHNPNLASVMAFFPDILPARKIIRPEPGMLIIFPSYLPHSTQPYYGDRPRISIAVNARGGLTRA